MTKRNILTSIEKLTPEVRSSFKKTYSYDDFYSIARRITTPNGDVLTVVPFETTDTSYLIKVKLKESKVVSSSNDDDDDDDSDDDDSTSDNDYTGDDIDTDEEEEEEKKPKASTRKATKDEDEEEDDEDDDYDD